MSRSPDQANARRDALSQLLMDGKKISTSALAKRFGVDAITIRRDLQHLEQTGIVIRRHGGAIPARRISFEFQFDQRHQTNHKQKMQIGQAAFEQIHEREKIFLDTGTTTLEIARAIRNSSKPCTVITSSLVISSELWACAHVELILLGGVVRQRSPDLVGSATEYMLDRLSADVAFLGSEGIDPNRGSFAESIETARISERMAANAKRVVVVADSSKLGIPGAARYASISDIDEIITDASADPAFVAALRRQDVTVTLA